MRYPNGSAGLCQQMNQDIAAEFQRRFPTVSSELGPDNLARLLNACTVVDLSPRRKVFRDRMPVDSLYLVLEGEMLASVEDSTWLWQYRQSMPSLPAWIWWLNPG